MCYSRDWPARAEQDRAGGKGLHPHLLQGCPETSGRMRTHRAPAPHWVVWRKIRFEEGKRRREQGQRAKSEVQTEGPLPHPPHPLHHGSHAGPPRECLGPRDQRAAARTAGLGRPRMHRTGLARRRSCLVTEVSPGLGKQAWVCRQAGLLSPGCQACPERGVGPSVFAKAGQAAG